MLVESLPLELLDNLSCSGASVSLPEPEFSSASLFTSLPSLSEEDDFSFEEEELDFSSFEELDFAFSEELEDSSEEESSCFGPDDESSPQAIKEHVKTRQKKNRILFMEPPLFGMVNITLFIW